MSGQEINRNIEMYAEEDMDLNSSIFHSVFSKYCNNYRRDITLSEDGVLQVMLQRCGNCEPCISRNGSPYEDPVDERIISREVVVKE